MLLEKRFTARKKVAYGMGPSAPIAVLDSGVGGLTVVKALRRELPHEDIIYFGDTARVPYGSKSGATITSFVRQIVRYLSAYEPKHIVVACNTATAVALGALREEFKGVSISGVIEPGAKAAAAAGGKKRFPVIGVIATEATIRSKAYEHALARRRNHARLLFRPAPLLVPIIEEGRSAEDPLMELAVQQYLTPMLQNGLDVLLLGCTHYPMIKSLIVKTVGPDVAVIDSADQCAEDVYRRLLSGSLLHASDRPGRLQCFVTDESPRFALLAKRFLGFEVMPPAWVPPEDLYRLPEGELSSFTGSET
jgi:glutamate racemase